MKRLIFVAAIGAGLSLSAAMAGDVATKCEAAMTAVGATGAEAGCACFDEALGEQERADYMAMDLATWASSASDPMKQAAATCFPTDNTNDS
ncbi:MAG: hypothetical protein AAF511_01485 [Pseudomonadota bacterium]